MTREAPGLLDAHAPSNSMSKEAQACIIMQWKRTTFPPMRVPPSRPTARANRKERACHASSQ